MYNKKISLTLLTIAAISLAPVASANVWADWLGQSQCNSQTEVCSYTATAFHGTDVLDLPDVGQGTMKLNQLTWGTCVFTTAAPCTSGSYSETLLAGQCSTGLLAISESLLVGGYATNPYGMCNPY